MRLTAAAGIAEQAQPGTLFLLEQGEGQEGQLYRAVLACPACGVLGLMTRAQYVGQASVICAASSCSAEYTLADGRIYFRAAQ